MKKIILLIFILACTPAKSQNSQYVNALNTDKGAAYMKLNEPIEKYESLKLKLASNQMFDTSLIKEYRPEQITYLFLKGAKEEIGRGILGSIRFYKNKLYSFQLKFTGPIGIQDSILNKYRKKYGNETNTNSISSLKSYYTKEIIWETDSVMFSVNLDEVRVLNCYIKYKSKTLEKEMLAEESLRKTAQVEQEKKLEEEEKEKEKSFQKINTPRIGKGNSTYIPDVTVSSKLLQANTSRTAFEKLLPNFSVLDSASKSYEYNPTTQQHDILKEIIYEYTFNYNKQYDVFLTVYMSKNQIIKRMDFKFHIEPFFINYTKQRTQSGFVINEAMSKMVSKMGLNKCIVYDNVQKIHLTEYTSKNFTLEKY